MVLNGGFSVKKAAESLGLKFSTCKTIVKTFREEGKLFKHSTKLGLKSRDKFLSVDTTKQSINAS